MNQSNTEGRKQLRNIVISLGVVALLGVGLVIWIEDEPAQQPPAPAPEAITDACWDLLETQQRLGELAIRGMEVYGRIDAALFEFSTDSPDVRVSPDAKPLGAHDDGAALVRFEEALKAVKAVPEDVARLRAGHDLARKECGEQCPGNVYPVTLERVTHPKNPDAVFYKWQVKGEAPTNAEWQQGFLNLYGGAPTMSCDDFAVLELLSPPEKKVAGTDPAMPQGNKAADEVVLMNQPAPKGRKDNPGGRDYSAGTAALSSNCTSKTKTQCQLCWLGPTQPGGYYFNGVKWCCGSC